MSRVSGVSGVATSPFGFPRVYLIGRPARRYSAARLFVRRVVLQISRHARFVADKSLASSQHPRDTYHEDATSKLLPSNINYRTPTWVIPARAVAS